MRSRWVSALLVWVLAVLLACQAHAFPFARTSGVTELTPATLPGFVNTHKPVVILFYAPWCGHCKQFHSEYERFAQAVKGAIRVGAINADQHSEVGGQFGIRGFPTIKYWKTGGKSIAAPEEYQSQRTANALQAFLMAGVSADKVRTNLRSTEALRQAVLAAPKKKMAVLFSTKNRVPPIFSILAHSPKLQELPFVFVEQKDAAESAVAAAFGVSALPTIAVVEAKEQQGEREGGASSPSFVTTPYGGKGIAYEPLAKFLLAAVEGDTPPGAGAATAVATDLDATEKAGTADNLLRVRKARKALPVGPAPFDVEETLPNFCVSPNDVVRLNGGVAWCVLSLSDKVDLKTLHAAYRNEPFLFFDASAVGAAALDGALQRQLSGLTLADCGIDISANGQDGVVLVRKTKAGTARVLGFTGVDSTNALESAMEKVSSGAAHVKHWKLA